MRIEMCIIRERKQGRHSWQPWAAVRKNGLPRISLAALPPCFRRPAGEVKVQLKCVLIKMYVSVSVLASSLEPAAALTVSWSRQQSVPGRQKRPRQSSRWKMPQIKAPRRSLHLKNDESPSNNGPTEIVTSERETASLELWKVKAQQLQQAGLNFLLMDATACSCSGFAKRSNIYHARQQETGTGLSIVLVGGEPGTCMQCRA